MSNATIPFGKPEIDENEIDAVVSCMKSGWLTTGRKTAEFEEVFGHYIGSTVNVAVSSCTAALHISLIASGVSYGDEVITTPLTFVSTLNVIEHIGATPVLVDISKDTFNIDPHQIEKAITKKTVAIIVVHYAGHPCDMNAINQIATKYNLVVIEDAAHALGARYNGKYIGDSENLVCFSFYPTKNITTAEGGMISTNNDKYRTKLLQLRLHGLSTDAWKRYTNTGSWIYDVTEPGFKYNMPDILAAIGIEQLKKVDVLNNKRYDLIERYKKNLCDYENFLVWQNTRENSIHSNFMFPICLDAPLERCEAIDFLLENKIQSSVLFIPAYKFSYYKIKYQYNIENLSICENVSSRLLCLPLYSSLDLADVDKISSCLIYFIEKHK